MVQTCHHTMPRESNDIPTPWTHVLLQSDLSATKSTQQPIVQMETNELPSR